MSNLSSLAQVLIGGVTGIITMAVGRISCRMNHKKEQPAPPPPVDPHRFVCGCGHNYVFHDLDANKCCAEQRTGGYMMSGRDTYGTPITTTECPCQRFCGPRPPVDIAAEWDLQFGHLT